MQTRRRAGLRSSAALAFGTPGGLLQDQLVQRQLGDGLPQPLILFLEPLEFLQLVGSHPAILLAPSVIGLLGDAHLADRVHALHALADKHGNLPQLLNNLFGLVPLVRHSMSSVS